MATDILNFLKLLKEQEETAENSSVQIDPISHQQQTLKMKKIELPDQEKIEKEKEAQRKRDEARTTHEQKIKKLLLSKRFEFVPDAEKLENNQFSFYDRDTTKGKSDLEVNHKGKLVKVELKGIHWDSEKQKQASYSLRYDNDIDIPVKAGKVSDKITLSPKDFHNYVEMLKKNEEGVPEPHVGDDVEQQSEKSRLYDLNFAKMLQFVSQFGKASSTLQQYMGTSRIAEKIKQGYFDKLAKRKLVKVVPHVLKSTGSHISIIGNHKGIHVVHHRDAQDNERPNIEDFLSTLGMAATHEPHEVNLSRSPGADPRGDESRGPIGFMGLSLSLARHPLFVGGHNKKLRDQVLEKIAAALGKNTAAYNSTEEIN